MVRSALMTLCALGVACGGASPVTPRADVSGSLGGSTISQPEVLLGEVMSSRGRVETLVLSISEAKGACALEKANQAARSTVTVTLTLKNDKGDTLHTGSYPIIAGNPTGSAGNYSTGVISKFDASCSNAYAGEKGTVTAGTVTLEAWQEGASATGSFDLTVGSEKLTGTFAAVLCAGFDQSLIDTSNTCQ